MPNRISTPGTEDDIHWMRLAIDEARKGLGATSPNPPVGAVIVKGGCFLAKGHHQKAGMPHAEIEAIQTADPADLIGATLYVTLEPCSTRGKTGACTTLIKKTGIRRVVIGCLDPNPKHSGKALKILNRAEIETTTGVLEKDCRNLIRFFAKHVTTRRPYVIAKTGMTLDGRIAPPPGGSQWITGEKARRDVQRLRSRVDAILVGGETVRRDDPALTLRGEFAPTNRPQPWRVVVTRSGRIPKRSKLLSDEFSDRTKVFHVEHLGPVLDELGEMDVTCVLLECGGRLMAQAFEEQLVDEITFYIAPLIGGGSRRAVEGKNFRCQVVDPRIQPVGPDMRVSAKVVYPESEE
ncbi:MAG: bifunctional diaminohydroxyphosphoribosylaminopyrimidine deaminase/5-amino-6-(5-phosphoribosylamino)uracil reductase RibD [Verrucomicrobiota bacterium]